MNLSDMQKWILGILGGLLLSAGGLYAGWINSNFKDAVRTAQSLALHNVDVDFDMEVLNAKLDLILRANKLVYEGPTFKSNRNHQDHIENQ